MAPTRRQVLASTATVIGGGIAVGVATQESNAQIATDVNGLSVPNENVSTDGQIAEILLTVDASYTYSLNTTPTRVILRLEAKTSDNYRQVDAISLSASNESSGTETLSGDISGFTGLSNMVPGERGTENTQAIDVQLTLEIMKDGQELGTADAQETTTLVVSKNEITIEASIGGAGGLEVTTEA